MCAVCSTHCVRSASIVFICCVLLFLYLLFLSLFLVLLVLCALIVYLHQPTIHIIMLTLFIRSFLPLPPPLSLSLASFVAHYNPLCLFHRRCSSATINIMNSVQTHAYIDFNYMFAHNRNDCMICIKNSHSTV